ncbi:hypothetical protein [Methylorubrum extorquens]|uniref:hypothetical protein n=1 Tax=Methylorubrum extorquens TaxID=408 RepID=UPI00209F8774|nr:hypothetical protein [Methylorubrum extorquens]MCP1540127.1 hypothetical protein [Methylorubrum extorquens]
MAIFYSDNAERSGGSISVPYSQWNANKGYLTHYENYLVLDFITRASKDRAEIAQARKELTICERKLEFWRKHPNFETAVVTRKVEEMKRQWEKR